MDMKAIFLQILDKNIEQEQMGKDLIVMLMLPYLEEMAAKSEGKIDDAVVKYIKEFVLSKVQ